MSYTRFVMPLECEASGYGFKGRTPAGRALAEARETTGKLTIYAQDIKTETRYGVYMIFRAENRYAGIFMGSLNADEKGKAEMRKDFNTSLLNPFNLQELVGVAVTASDIPPSVVAPLCAYRENPVSWRGSFFIPANEIAEPEPVVEPEPAVEPTPEPVVEPAPEPEPVVEPEPEPTPAPKRKAAPRARKPKA
jgi:hypothetical protein